LDGLAVEDQFIQQLISRDVFCQLHLFVKRFGENGNLETLIYQVIDLINDECF
jgi:hypothetical protein